jgi:CMP-N-acetylneuraminic acid synthetase|tara:strand:+ start:492 stop:1127 length:636 start_codon:yes stop_codon:yes gene_type:complete
MKIKTVILARGGSKGIPKKNIIDINGKPLIQYTIEAAQKSKANDVFISTNDEDIMSCARNAGAKVVIRPDSISGDTSKSEDALIHFCRIFAFDILVFIQPTSPLLLPEDINKGIEMMGQYDSVFSAYKEHWIPRWTIEGKPDGWNPHARPMRQQCKENWVENGALYITTKDSLLKNNLRYHGNTGIVEMPIRRSFQVDTYDDLELISKLLK